MIRYLIFIAIFGVSFCDEYIEWCEEPDIRRRISSGDCNQLSIVYPSPRCICVKGIASLDIAGGPELFFGNGGCFSTAAYGQIVNSLRLEKSIDTEKYLVAVQSISATIKSSPWLFHELTGNPKLLYTNAPYYLVNVEAVDVGQKFKGLPIICLKHQFTTNSPGMVRYMKMVSFPEVYLLPNRTCTNGKSMDDTDLVASNLLVSYANRQCTPTCPALDNPAEATTLDMRDNLNRLQDLHNRKHIQQRTLESNSPQKCQSIEPEDKPKHAKLNKKLILEFIRESFSVFSDGAVESRAFQILNKFFFIAKQYCKAAKIPSAFLLQALRSFKVVQRELSPSMEELFISEEFQALFHLISHCQWELSSLRMSTHGCSRQSNWITSIFHPAGGEDHFDIPISDSYQKLSKHHLVVDVPYHVTDIALQACRRSFQRSPHLLEKLRAGMLKVFTSDAIHKFWTNSETLSNFNEHLFGPYWTESARSLLKCAEAAYAFNGNSNRPMRPNADESLETTSIASANCDNSQQLNSASDSYGLYCMKESLKAEGPNRDDSVDYLLDESTSESSNPPTRIHEIATPQASGQDLNQHRDPIAEIPVAVNEPTGTTRSPLTKLTEEHTARIETSTESKILAVKATMPPISKPNQPARSSLHIPVLTGARSFHRAVLKHSNQKMRHKFVPSVQAYPLWPLVPDDDPGEAISRGSGRSIGKGVWNSLQEVGKSAGDSVKHPHESVPGNSIGNYSHHGKSMKNNFGKAAKSSRAMGADGEGSGDGSTPPAGPPASHADGEVIIIDWPDISQVGSSGGTGPSGSAAGPATGDMMVTFPEDQEDPSVGGEGGEGGEGSGVDGDPTLDFPGSPEPEPNPGTGPSQGTGSSQGTGPSQEPAPDPNGDTMITFPEDQEGAVGEPGGVEGGEAGDDENDPTLDFEEPSGIDPGSAPAGQGGSATGDIMVSFPEDEAAGETGGGEVEQEEIVSEEVSIDFPGSEGGEGSESNVDDIYVEFPEGGAGGGSSGGISEPDPSGNNGTSGAGVETKENPEGILLDWQSNIGAGGSGGGTGGSDGTGEGTSDGNIGGGSENGTTGGASGGSTGGGSENKDNPEGILLDWQSNIGSGGPGGGMGGSNGSTGGGSENGDNPEGILLDWQSNIGSGGPGGGMGGSNGTTGGGNNGTTGGPKPPPSGQKYPPGYIFYPKPRKNRRTVRRKARHQHSKSH